MASYPLTYSLGIHPSADIVLNQCLIMSMAMLGFHLANTSK